jgi:proteasome beta subunit
VAPDFDRSYLTAGTSSFADFLNLAAPGLLPARIGGADMSQLSEQVPHGTTIVAAVCAGGVVMAADRRATAGNVIAQRNFEKLFRSDDYSAVGIAGSAGLGVELARLFQVELEHYEKLEGRALSIEGKANRLAGMVRGNLGAAMQGFAMIPLFAGYDEAREVGRIFSYDVVGGRYEEHRFYGIGSGSVYARGSLKKLYRDGMSVSDAIMVCMQALYDAADDDSATGGPDLSRRIFPMAVSLTADGFEQLTESEASDYAHTVVAERLERPDGPAAPLTELRRREAT